MRGVRTLQRTSAPTSYTRSNPTRRSRLLLKDSAILQAVEGEGGPNETKYSKLLNLLMQLRKCCDHPFLFPDAEEDPNSTPIEELVAASGKLRVLDRLLLKLHANGHRVVLFSQVSCRRWWRRGRRGRGWWRCRQ